MNDERSEPSHKSWLERLSLALMGEPKDRDALIAILRDARQRELLDTDALTMMEGVMKAPELQVRDVMLPRAQMVVLKHDWSLERLISAIVESGHSRFPVIDDSKDNVIGILIVKDLLAHAFDRREDFDLRTLLRPAKFIPESKRLNVLLKEFRSNRLHMAIVVDEYAGVSGLITIEDVLEQIVGEIEDEYDFDESEGNIRPDQFGRFRVKAQTSIEDFNEHFGSKFVTDEYNTVGGLILNHLGRVPGRKEEITLAGLNFMVLRADRRRLYTLLVTRGQAPDEAS